MENREPPKKKVAQGTYIALGISIGTAIGVALKNIAIGVGIGTAFGTILEVINNKKNAGK